MRFGNRLTDGQSDARRVVCFAGGEIRFKDTVQVRIAHAVTGIDDFNEEVVLLRRNV